jgi:hypothetical protein
MHSSQIFGQSGCPNGSTPSADFSFSATAQPQFPIRTLKIEEDGDFWKGPAKPKIRLMGRWLERAGFKPGSHVQVTCLGPGIIELRCPDYSPKGEIGRPIYEQADLPL